ncbi:MAG: hypothetical protein IJY28_08970 [Clostridia bacterium]|nr:hypothetical protein [Clostridia bacterium]
MCPDDFIIENGILTKYTTPELRCAAALGFAAHAIQCTAYLLNWRHAHLPDAGADFLLN